MTRLPGPRTAPDRPKRLTTIQTHSSGMGRDRSVGVQGGGDSRVDERLQAGGGVGALGADERRVELRSVINVVGVQSLFPGIVKLFDVSIAGSRIGVETA